MRDSTVLSQWRVTSGLPVIQEPRPDLRLGSLVGSHEFARPTTPCSNPLAFHRNLTTMQRRPAMPPNSRQVDVQHEHGERNSAPSRGATPEELATAAGAGDLKLTEPKLLPDGQE